MCGENRKQGVVGSERRCGKERKKRRKRRREDGEEEKTTRVEGGPEEM